MAKNMANEDVIELGSSDEESQPAQKKAKPRPNAMVHIPTNAKMPKISYKPSKSNINTTKLSKSIINTAKPSKSNINTSKPNINPIKKLMGKDLTIKKVNNTKPAVNLNSLNGKALIKPFVPRIQGRQPKAVGKPVTLPPVKIIGNIKPNSPKLQNDQKLPSIRNIYSLKRVNIPVKNTLTNLPSSVTVTRTPGNKRPLAGGTSNVKKKQKITPKVMTVELDDDDSPAPSTSGPQWYLRPEDQTSDPLLKTNTENENNIENENNAEPEPSKFIEITIEDSPVKPVHNKRTHEIGAELAITIEDSPSKSTNMKEKSAGSDNEKTDTVTKEPHSKKKLEYPKAIETSNTIEIEIEPYEIEETEEAAGDKTESKDKENEQQDVVIEIFESPLKTPASPHGTPKKQGKQIVGEAKKNLDTIVEVPESGEFHPVYQEFIDLCFKLDNSNDMKTIVEKKIKSYYKQCPVEYTESEEFIDMVSSKLLAMKAGPAKLYLYIKDIVDELNMQRKMAKSKVTALKETREKEAENFQYGEDSEFDSKRQRQIRKLEKTIRKLHRAIQKLEEQEVDFDDEEDSVYLLTERYKERMVRVHTKLCQLTNTKMPSEPRITIEPRPGQPAGPAKRLEKWVNRKVPIGKPLPFPDFHDVLRCVKEANEEDKLRWNDADVMEEARDLFTRCGKKLQRRRQENEWRLAASRIQADTDPAETSEELKRKLETNKQLATKKETDVFNKYADKQSQLKLEGEEIGDKEAEESPVESDDEVVEESSNLENKEKRKERLRRLIQEKSRKPVDEKENEPKETVENQNDTKTISEDNDNENDKKENDNENKQVEVNALKDATAEKMDVDKSQSETTNTISKERIHSVSDDKVDSDVDELHLLQKLHSDEINSSTIDSSDSESPIDISDTLQSSSDNKGKQNDDVISIENSSYSESEDKGKHNPDEKENEEEKKNEENAMDIDEVTTGEVEYSNAGISKNKTTDQENNENAESILLASSDDDSINSDSGSFKSKEDCINLKDDAISIGESTVAEIHSDQDKTDIVKEHASSNSAQCEVMCTDDNTNSVESVVETSCKKDNACVEESPKSAETVEEENTAVERVIINSDSQESLCSEVVTDDKVEDNVAEKDSGLGSTILNDETPQNKDEEESKETNTQKINVENFCENSIKEANPKDSAASESNKNEISKDSPSKEDGSESLGNDNVSTDKVNNKESLDEMIADLQSDLVDNVPNLTSVQDS